MKTDTQHQKLLESLKESLNLTQDSYNEFLETKAYYEGNQLPQYIKAILLERGQPILFENMYALIGEKLLGYKINANTEMNAIGFQKREQTKDYQITKQKCDLDLMFGMCACEVWLEETKDNEDLKITIKHIPINSLYIDPYSQREDGKDSKYFHKVLYMDKEEMQLCYPKRKDWDISDNQGDKAITHKTVIFRGYMRIF